MKLVCSDDPTHQSSTLEFCSVCGAPVDDVDGKPGLVATPPVSKRSSAGITGKCPTCGMARIPGDDFCANCGTDYATGSMAIPEPEAVSSVSATAPFSTMTNNPAARVSPSPAVPHVVAPSPVGASRLNTEVNDASSGPLRAILRVDLTPREGRDADAVPPTDQNDRLFILDKEILLFGRTSTWMPIPDAGASRNHGEFVRQPDGTYCVRDIGSANGTSLNGALLNGQELRKIKRGDIIAIGFWHVVKIE